MPRAQPRMLNTPLSEKDTRNIERMKLKLKRCHEIKLETRKKNSNKRQGKVMRKPGMEGAGETDEEEAEAQRWRAGPTPQLRGIFPINSST